MQAARLARSIICGEKQGLAADAVRSGLAGVAFCYQVIISLRNWMYDRGLKKSFSVPIPVISVGNITAGGTGKTPMVVWLCRYAQGKGLKTAVLTRGYKAVGEGDSDEVRVLRSLLSESPVVVDADRVRGGQKAIREHQAGLLVMDDGFQHRRLRRNLDIVLIDATCPFGFDRLLPAGFLREPLAGLRRADVVILTRTEQVGPERLTQIRQTLLDLPGKKPDLIWVESQTLPVAWRVQDRMESPKVLMGKKVLAVAGIGNPQAFLASLWQLGVVIVGQELYGDHHRYNRRERVFLAERLAAVGADFLVTTQKDWVKLVGPEGTIDPRWGWLEAEMVITAGKESLCQRLDGLLEGVR